MRFVKYGALLILSFGGPEGPDEVMPFLRRVTEGRGVPEARLLEVAEHYAHFGGKSPLPRDVRALADAVRKDLSDHGIALPVYVGFRNSSPFVHDALAEMKRDGVERAVAFATSAFSSYSGCRQYLEDIEKARAKVEAAPVVDKIRPFYEHPRFVEAVIDRVRAAISQQSRDELAKASFLFTAHSIPDSMAAGCSYESELRTTMGRVVAALSEQAGGNLVDRSALVFQSRSGPPQVPWLGPDICDAIDDLASRGTTHVVAVPLGFVSDHVEVLHDLDVEAAQRAKARGVTFVRAQTVGIHPAIVTMVRELATSPTQAACAAGCCPRGASQRPASAGVR
jgi:ferrochelatase